MELIQDFVAFKLYRIPTDPIKCLVKEGGSGICCFQVL